MRRLPQSIFGLVALASLGLALATTALGGIVYVASHEALEQQLDQRIEVETHHLVNAATQGIPALITAIKRREDGHRTSEMGYMLFAPDGRKVAGRLEAKRPAPGWHELLPLTDADEGEQEVAQALMTPLADGYALVVCADRTPIDEIDKTIIQMFAIAFGAMLLIGVGCAWALGLVVRRRLARISTTAEAVIDGNLSQRVPRDPSRNEFDRLGETLNKMLDRNEALLENLRQVSSDIAHDMRLPLARQKQALDAALAQPLDNDGYRAAISEAARAGQEILDLFAALLRISEIETYKVREGFRPVELGEVVERVVDAFRASAEASGHVLETRIDPAPPVSGDRHLLSQLLANLIENALTHTPPGTAVTVRLETTYDTTVLSVIDTGPGIPDADHDRVMQRFVRLEASRTTPGHGLGMSLVAAIAAAHFARVTLVQGNPGLAVRIAFDAAA